MLQAIGTGCGCADDRFRKTSLCSALVLTYTIVKMLLLAPAIIISPLYFTFGVGD